MVFKSVLRVLLPCFDLNLTLYFQAAFYLTNAA